MQTNDAGHLFQTADEIAKETDRKRKRSAANSIGRPVETGKIIDFVVVGSDAFLAESGWQARQLDLKSGKTLRVFKGHRGPVTSVAVFKQVQTQYLATGSWDKTIKLWNVQTGELLHTIEAHEDFVKSLTVVGSHLLSTSTDRCIKIWSLEPQADMMRCIQTVKEHTRPVDCLSVLSEADKDHLHVMTADSMGVMLDWRLEAGNLVRERGVPGHETSITSIAVTEDGVWTSSMDKTIRFRPSTAPDSVRELSLNTHVHSILPLPGTMTSRNLIVAGGGDEDLQVWETDDEWISSRLVSRVRGHCAAVTTLRLWNKLVVSGSLDGTIRQWTLEALLNPVELQYDEQEASSGMTEDEERELAELMDE